MNPSLPPIVPLPAFRDNYIWALRKGDAVAVVDPGDAQPVMQFLHRERARLVAILATHHHQDHVGGIATLREEWDVPVYGPRDEPIEQLTVRVGAGDKVNVPELEAQFEVLGIPGHTRAHIAYFGRFSGSNVVFCGDTLFACGCGRLFEGTAEQMHASLSRLMALPDDTFVYCGHEYTMANIAFAEAVEPGNGALKHRRERDAALRQRGEPTLPSKIADEKATNPFVRATEPSVVQAAADFLRRQPSSPVAVFAALREWKNNF